MKKIKAIFLGFCVVYTTVSLMSGMVKVAWAFDDFDLRWTIENIISDKISSFNYDFKQAVGAVVEQCQITENGIDC